MPPADVAAALRAVTDAKPYYTPLDPDFGDFRGRVSNDGFKVRWKSGGRYKPPLVLYGAFQATPDGCAIEVVARPTFVSVVLLSLFYLVVVTRASGLPHSLAGFIWRLVGLVPVYGIAIMANLVTFGSRIYDLKARLCEIWRAKVV